MRSILKRTLFLFLFTLLSAVISSCKKDNSAAGETPPAVTTPQITGIQPKNPQPGDVVTIAGTGFGTAATDVKVTIGSTEVTISSVTATEIKFTIPANLTSGTLALAIKGVAATNKDPQGGAISVTPKPVTVPTFTAMSPASGKTGDVITLTGTNFNPQISENRVFFATNTAGTVVLATIKSATSTTLTVEVPATAVTGGILITVSGADAVPATGFNTTFTVNSSIGGTGSNNVSYIEALTGNLGFSKIASATNEIGTMYYDKVKNFIYFSDYTLLTQTGSKVYKLDPGGNASPVALTNDARITNIVKICTDVNGNVYTLRYENVPNKMSLFKISADGSTVTEIAKDFSTEGTYFLFVNANNEICLRPNFKITQSGNIVTTTNNIFGLQQGTEGAVFNNNSAYIAYSTDGYSNNCIFMKWNLNDGTTVNTNFSLTSLYGNYDPERVKSSKAVGYLRYAVDDSENFYTLIDRSYISGQQSTTWVINKTKNGSTDATNIGTFRVKFPALNLNDFTGSVALVSDARGNLYIKANQKDILRITQ